MGSESRIVKNVRVLLITMSSNTRILTSTKTTTTSLAHHHGRHQTLLPFFPRVLPVASSIYHGSELPPNYSLFSLWLHVLLTFASFLVIKYDLSPSFLDNLSAVVCPASCRRKVKRLCTKSWLDLLIKKKKISLRTFYKSLAVGW